ncbi:MAG TPA: PilX N-terminal domain-containing pilus assembly protein, partial [Gemmatimonadaceae bacterium]|nr:PilX N-terminal domain-containing pilus assembly protein [Gemmatimonadaceae bacterium]
MMMNRRGFVLPSVIFAITIMSVIAVVALNTATDESHASRATRESTLAMYAAEAGLRQTYGAWPSAAV